ncbi:MAG: hypothetical protein WBN32_00765 [Woeseia sp.]
MSLIALSYAVVLALPAAALFAALLAAAQWLGPFLPRRRAFLATIPTAPADRLWRRQHRLGRQRSRAVLPLMVFIITTALLTVAEPQPPAMFSGAFLPLAGVAIGLLIAMAALAYAIWLTVARQRLRLLIDANLAIAQALEKLSNSRNRSFHDVPTPAGTLDHVIAGIHGIYAVSVIARQPGKSASRQLQLRGDVLTFSDGGPTVKLQPLNHRVLYFARQCSKVVGHDVQVRHVIAIPGWEIAAQADKRLLIANEKNIAMLTGWKDERDHLMDEDVALLHQHLDERCSRPI